MLFIVQRYLEMIPIFYQQQCQFYSIDAIKLYGPTSFFFAKMTLLPTSGMKL